MINLYHPQATTTPTDRPARQPRSRFEIPESFWLLREQRRYEFVAEKLREAGLSSYAELCDRWAEQTRMEAVALAKMDERIAALDAKLAGSAA